MDKVKKKTLLQEKESFVDFECKAVSYQASRRFRKTECKFIGVVANIAKHQVSSAY
jgi:hypothetical protein